MVYIVVGLMGLVAGGIINILADDLPERRQPSTPHYPDGTPRSISAWLGISAFLTGQRVSSSGSRLSWRYPLTEVGTMLLMWLTIFVTAENPEVSDLQLVFYLAYIAIFVLITVIDIEHRLILFVVIIPASLLAILDAILTPVTHKPDLRDALLGGALGFGVFFLLFLGGILFSYVVAKIQGYELPEVAFGYGDVMLSLLSGLILGWQPMIIAMFVTVFVGAAGAIIFLTIRGLSGRYDVFTPLPYGPYIVLGTLLLLLFPDGIQSTLLNSSIWSLW
jgi:prepilin signal peptidase PulO-like enzyme (type II secretory pathway)